MRSPESKFIALRHGLTDWNRAGRFQGRTDIALNDDGIAQARAAAEIVQPHRPIEIVSSPLVRAMDTAKIVASALGLQVSPEPRLIECNFGSFEGVSIRETMEVHKISAKEDLARILPPDAEAWPEVSRRALAAICEWQSKMPGGLLLFVSHDAVMQSIAEQLSGHWFDNRHGTPYVFEPIVDGWRVSALG